jgi:hypothetical protein
MRSFNRLYGRATESVLVNALRDSRSGLPPPTSEFWRPCRLDRYESSLRQAHWRFCVKPESILDPAAFIRTDFVNDAKLISIGRGGNAAEIINLQQEIATFS